MPYGVPNGFISRADAQRPYQRSKSSFIRDVDDALQRDDSKLLRHFCILLNDGGEIAGVDATKEAVQAVQSKQPRWYVSIDLLETRSWTTDSPPPDESANAVERPVPRPIAASNRSLDGWPFDCTFASISTCSSFLITFVVASCSRELSRKTFAVT